MKNIIKLVIVLCLTLTSCSETTEYELPYELSPVTGVNAVVDVSGTNVVCSNASVDFTVDSESTVYYVVLPVSDTKPSSSFVFDNGNAVSFDEAGSKSVVLTGLDLSGSYMVNSITVNKDGTRSSEVSSVSFTTPSFDDVINQTLAVNYKATPKAFGDIAPEFDAVFNDEDGSLEFSVESLWGPNFVSWATGDPSYEGSFVYPGTITLNSDFSVTVTSDEFYALGGEGSFDPCTKTFYITIVNDLFGDPFETDVEFVAAD